MNLLVRNWKKVLFVIANAIYTYVEHDNLIDKAVKAEIPSHYTEIVNRHIQRAIEERNKPKEKFPTPYFYVPGKGAIEQQQAIAHDFKKTYAYNAKVDAVLEKAGISTADTYTSLMENRYTDATDL